MACDLPAPDWIRSVRVFATIDELTEHFLASHVDDPAGWEAPADGDGLTEDQWLAQADIKREATWDDMWGLEERLTGRRHPWVDDYSPLTETLARRLVIGSAHGLLGAVPQAHAGPASPRQCRPLQTFEKPLFRLRGCLLPILTHGTSTTTGHSRD